MSAQKTILSIDDSKAVHAYLDHCLEGNDYKLVHAMTAEEGIGLLQKSDSFSLVLLDWEMPGMCGPEALVKILQLRPKLPVIMITTKNDPTEIQDMLQKGAKEYVMKPFTPDIILEKMDSVLSLEARE